MEKNSQFQILGNPHIAQAPGPPLPRQLFKKSTATLALSTSPKEDESILEDAGGLLPLCNRGHFHCLIVWYVGCSIADKKMLNRGVINTAEKIIGCPIPSLQDIADTCLHSRTKKTLLILAPINLTFCP